MNSYWVSWWSECDFPDVSTMPETWHTGARCGSDGSDGWFSSYSYCSLIVAESEEAVWDLVRKHYPDYEERFCDPRPAGYEVTSDRFPKGDN